MEGKGHMNHFGYGKDKDTYNFFRGSPQKGSSVFEDLSWVNMDLDKYKRQREELERLEE